MSKFDAEKETLFKNELDDLLRRWHKIHDQYLLLDNQKKMVESAMLDMLKQLKTNEYKKIKRVVYTTEKVGLEDFNSFEDVIPFAIAEIDKSTTLRNMYSGGIDYKVAERRLEHAIEKSKHSEVGHEEIKIG